MENTRFFLRNVLVILLCGLVPISFIHAGNIPKTTKPSRVKEKSQRIRTISNKEIPAIENLEEITLKKSDGAAITLVPYSNYVMQQYMLSR